MADNSWDEFKRKNVERFGESQARAWLSTVEFWKHLVMVEATVLGLTVGLLGQVREPSALLVMAWVALLAGIFVGCLLVRSGIDAERARAAASFRTGYDMAEIETRVISGALRKDSSEHTCLVLAAVMQSVPEWERDRAFPPGARATGEQWLDRLPSATLVKNNRATVFVWLERHLGRVEFAFYALSVAAFLLMIVATAMPSGGRG